MLNTRILGDPPNDNALWVVVDSGQRIHRLMFDCGADTLRGVPIADIQAIDHLFLSHLHMDHISGFDTFFRLNFQRSNKANQIWGPAGTAAILGHRFQGFWWSHAHELDARWLVHDVSESEISTYRFEASEAFAIPHLHDKRTYDGTLVKEDGFVVEAIPLKHHGLCLGFVVREATRLSVNMGQLAKHGLKAGPWVAQLKNGKEAEIVIDGVVHQRAHLETKLLDYTEGDSVAYLTDFSADAEQRRLIAPRLVGVKTLYAEAQYATEDLALADKYHHSTVDQIAQLSKMAGVGQYVLLHLSRRYSPADWVRMLASAQAIFPNSRYVDEWQIGVSD